MSQQPPDDLAAMAAAFIEAARWFGGKGRPFTVTGMRELAVADEADREGDPRLSVDLVEVRYDDEAGGTELYQLPLSSYTAWQDHLERALVDTREEPGRGWCHLYDALQDRAALPWWLRAFDTAASGDLDTGGLRFHRLPGHDLDLEARGSLFSGEQSNSSVMYGEDALMKVFRKVTPGANPDVAVHDVLTRAGSHHVAALYGWLETELDGEPVHLAMLQQFLRTASDGWDLALASVRNLFLEGDLHADEVGGDFAAEAARLGTALREVHDVLAEHFGTDARGADAARELAETMGSRLDEALAVVPELEPYAAQLRSTFDAVRGLDGLEVQTVHGDLHLGQTLRTSLGWKLVDFEGEPAKPLAERQRPDSRWRDVAGMMRSFDYAPRVVERTLAADSPVGADQRDYRANEWSARNRAAFLAAYADGEPTEGERLLLTAYTADKAVYETVYETRNRPSWVAIPLAAIARIEAP